MKNSRAEKPKTKTLIQGLPLMHNPRRKNGYNLILEK